MLWGSETLTDTLCGLRFSLSPHSFYQVNRDQAERLYAVAADDAALTGEETLLDLYCGAGTIGLSMAAKAKRLVGVEIVEDAVKKRARTRRRTASKTRSSSAVTRPRRRLCSAGAGKRRTWSFSTRRARAAARSLSPSLRRWLPPRVVYVSCDPATLARDLAWFAARGYAPQKAQPVDLFPRTHHVETVVLLSKLNTKQHIEVELNLDELDLTAAESKATYEEIKEYVLEHTGLKSQPPLYRPSQTEIRNYRAGELQ